MSSFWDLIYSSARERARPARAVLATLRPTKAPSQTEHTNPDTEEERLPGSGKTCKLVIVFAQLRTLGMLCGRYLKVLLKQQPNSEHWLLSKGQCSKNSLSLATTVETRI